MSDHVWSSPGTGTVLAESWNTNNLFGVERVMIERIEKEDIQTQIYRDKLIISDDDGKIRERRSLNPNLKRYIDTPQPHYMNWRENTPRKKPIISPQPYSSCLI